MLSLYWDHPFICPPFSLNITLFKKPSLEFLVLSHNYSLVNTLSSWPFLALLGKTPALAKVNFLTLTPASKQPNVRETIVSVTTGPALKSWHNLAKSLNATQLPCYFLWSILSLTSRENYFILSPPPLKLLISFCFSPFLLYNKRVQSPHGTQQWESVIAPTYLWISLVAHSMSLFLFQRTRKHFFHNNGRSKEIRSSWARSFQCSVHLTFTQVALAKLSHNMMGKSILQIRGPPWWLRW